MAIIVVGGSGRGAGKTALICGLIRALPDFAWTAVKITTHAHGHAEPIYEEKAPGPEEVRGPETESDTDTARYLAAGARRALLVTAEDHSLASIVHQIIVEHSSPAHLVFESNSVLHHLRPDLCLAVASDLRGARKPSYGLLEERMDASVALGGHNHVIPGARIHFHLRSLERISPTMLAWVREKVPTL
jgi:hypothetical protein